MKSAGARNDSHLPSHTFLGFSNLWAKMALLGAVNSSMDPDVPVLTTEHEKQIINIFFDNTVMIIV